VRIRREPARDPDGTLLVDVAHVDRFGNVILWLRPGEIGPGGEPDLLLPGGDILPLHRAATYAGGRGLLLVEGSLGLMEIALDGGSAAADLGVSAGDALRLVVPS